MLGSMGDAEDVVQDAWLRWQGGESTASDAIRSPEAWLVTVATRLCLDRLRSRAAERAAYVGPWLPEPWVEEEPLPGSRLEQAGDLSLAFIALLERLAPEERAAFLLHEVFETGYPDIARTLGRSEAACRQMVHRARERVRHDRPRFPYTHADLERLVRRYLDAVRARDKDGLLALFAEDARLVSDGGGKVWAARNVIVGAERIARLELGLATKRPGRFETSLVRVNGAPGLVTFRNGRLQAVTAFESDGRQLLQVLRILNPDKLRHVAIAPPAG
jgi:RNA polymerase sigma-70 factor, ECF subfamily